MKSVFIALIETIFGGTTINVRDISFIKIVSKK